MHHTASLSAPRRRLIHMIENARFGAIERLLVKDGEPVFGPGTILIRDRKFGKKDPSAAHEVRESPIAKMQFEQMFEEFSDMGNGEIALLEFHNGLPFKIRIREQLAN